MPLALTVKSVSGSRAAQSCDGCAAVWMTTAMARPWRCEQRAHGAFVADVGVDVRVIAQRRFELVARPARRGVGAEEARAHVVVDADDVRPLAAKARRFRADQARRTGDDGNASCVLYEA